MLEEATSEHAFIKVALYGGPGSGKTFTALQWATALGKTALLDTERGSDFYAADFKFLVLHTRKVQEAIDAVQEAVAKDCKCIIVDQLTHLWEAAQEEYIAREHEKMSKAWYAIEKNGSIPWTAWRSIKKPYKKLLRELLNAPMHVFLLGRLATEYEVSGGEPKKVGERMDTERNTPYEPHILIKLELQHKKKHVAWVEKDRSGTIQGKVVTDPGLEMLMPVIKKLNLGIPQGAVPIPIEDESSVSIVDAGTASSAQQKLIRTMAKKGGFKEKKIASFLETLSREEAGEVINRMTKKDFTMLNKEELHEHN